MYIYHYIQQTASTEFIVSLIGSCKNRFHLFRFNRKVALLQIYIHVVFFSFIKIFNIHKIHVHVYGYAYDYPAVFRTKESISCRLTMFELSAPPCNVESDWSFVSPVEFHCLGPIRVHLPELTDRDLLLRCPGLDRTTRTSH